MSEEHIPSTGSGQAVYRFRPANPGEFLAGIPARDLTAADLEIDPSIEALITMPGPSGRAMYQRVKSDLSAMTRGDLNDLAAKRGVAAPEALPNKEAVIAAIEAAKSEPPKDPPETGGDKE